MVDKISSVLRASVVVLSYNGFDETTGPCLESVIANTTGDYELIVIDNASTDSTQDSLRMFARQHDRVRIQTNDINKGFAGGNNDGIKLACGEFVILLNNDTLVPAGWLDRLLQQFDDNPMVGLIGPVTNSAGNEQRIELEGLNESNYERVAGDYIELQKGAWFSTKKLGFFCVAIRKDVIENIGLLDEAFGVGMFEDDDYCLRAKQAGYRLAVVEDCFVYHKGSISFKKLTNTEYIDLFDRNRIYYFKKHGVLWHYVDIALSIWHKISVDIESWSTPKDEATFERISCRLSNMTDALFQLKIVEENHAVVDGERLSDTKLIEMQKQLMVISDWATELKEQRDAAQRIVTEKHQQLMKISDWATSLKQDNDRLIAKLSDKQGKIYGFCNLFLHRFYRRFFAKGSKK